MKRIISIILITCMLFLLSACGGGGGSTITETPDLENTTGYVQGEISGGDYSSDIITETDPNNPTVLGVFYRNVIGAEIQSDDSSVKEVDSKAQAMLKKIEDYPDTLKAAEGGKTYYLSNDGDDTNDGLTPETARKTYVAVKTVLAPGDVVLFRRGDIFRGQINTISGVSFGAYGSGIKPRIYGSIDATEGEWEETSTKGVYTYKNSATYANIIFNNGEAVGRPVSNLADITKKPLNVYYNGRVNLYCPEGNPKDVFNSIEIVVYYISYAKLNMQIRCFYL